MKKRFTARGRRISFEEGLRNAQRNGNITAEQRQNMIAGCQYFMWLIKTKEPIERS